MSAPLAIYVRVSEVGDREGPGFGSPEEQEAAAREWAEKAYVKVYFNKNECVDLDVSGAAAVEDRKLGALIERCEAGEFGGIIVRDERRFARDEVKGGVALDRLVKCGARLKATWSGFDTGPESMDVTPESRLMFDIMMSIGKAERTRNRLSRVAGNRRAFERGWYLASSAPLGYHFVDAKTDRRIVPDTKTAPLLKELFRRRADGESLRSLAEWLRGKGIKIGKSGVRVALTNRAYLGEATCPTEKKGELKIDPKHQPPLVTPDLWERAQAAGGPYHPRNGKWASQAHLTGMAVCSGCGKPLSAHGGGKRRETAYYSCTSERCPARVGIRVDRLDIWVEGLLQDAVIAGVPEVIAVLEGDDRHARALEAINAASLELEAYIENVKVSDLGRDAWIRGKEARQATLDLARKELASIPAPKPVSRAKARKLMSFEEALPGLRREWNARFIERVVVQPVGRGRRVPVAERVEVWFVGAERAVDVAAFMPAGDPDALAVLKTALSAEEILKDLEEAAAQGDKAAKEYLAATA